jgi:hypothetical protein
MFSHSCLATSAPSELEASSEALSLPARLLPPTRPMHQLAQRLEPLSQPARPLPCWQGVQAILSAPSAAGPESPPPAVVVAEEAPARKSVSSHQSISWTREAGTPVSANQAARPSGTTKWGEGWCFVSSTIESADRWS